MLSFWISNFYAQEKNEIKNLKKKLSTETTFKVDNGTVYSVTKIITEYDSAGNCTFYDCNIDGKTDYTFKKQFNKEGLVSKNDEGWVSYFYFYDKNKNIIKQQNVYAANSLGKPEKTETYLTTYNYNFNDSITSKKRSFNGKKIEWSNTTFGKYGRVQHKYFYRTPQGSMLDSITCKYLYNNEGKLIKRTYHRFEYIHHYYDTVFYSYKNDQLVRKDSSSGYRRIKQYFSGNRIDSTFTYQGANLEGGEKNTYNNKGVLTEVLVYNSYAKKWLISKKYEFDNEGKPVLEMETKFSDNFLNSFEYKENLLRKEVRKHNNKTVRVIDHEYEFYK